MSELQNRIVQRLAAAHSASPLQPYDRHKQLIIAAVRLYYSAGGDAKALRDVVENVGPAPEADAPVAVANLMVEIAAVSQACDLDMVQAAYNWIDGSRQSS